MRPARFAYRDPSTLDGVLAELREWGDEASVLAGGQSLIPLLNMRLARPEVVIDLQRVPGLDGVDVDGPVRLGTAVRARTVEHDPAIAARLPVLVEAIRHVAHPQIRNRTTIGGSLAHADPSSELPGVLAALDGHVELASDRGSRTVPWDRFFAGPFTTTREPDELLTSATFPVPSDLRLRFLEFARRRGEYPIAGVCVGVRSEAGLIADARLAAIGVGPGPMRLYAAEQVLVGAMADDQEARVSAAATARAEVDPSDDIHGSAAFRRGMVAILIRRALDGLAEGAEHGG